MSKQIRCDNCGKYLGTLPDDHADFEAPSLGGIAYRGGIIGRIKYFCNNNCKKEWKNKKNEDSSSRNSFSSEKDAEMERLKWEQEQAEKREKKEKKARLKAKAEETKDYLNRIETLPEKYNMETFFEKQNRLELLQCFIIQIMTPRKFMSTIKAETK